MGATRDGAEELGKLDFCFLLGGVSGVELLAAVVRPPPQYVLER